ncbi:MAG: PAS domain-containing sensor histidine kinase [Candidatus Lokiarchaeota archaeon]|nr:PAS domain-containing sensor histidine kinase [Candidatus Lokiarchaeota archaeon]
MIIVAINKNQLKQSYMDGIEFIIKNIADVIMELDSELAVVFISPKIYDVSGYRSTEILGNSILDYVHPEDHQKLKKSLREVIKTEKNISLDFRLKHKNGNYVPTSFKCALVRLNEKIVPMAVLSENVDQRRFEVELKEYVEKYENLVQYTSDIIAEIDMKGIIKYVTPQVYDVTGEKPEFFLGKKWTAFASSNIDDVKKLLHPSQPVDEIEFDYETVHIRNQSKIWLEVRGKRFTDRQGKKRDLIIARDVTEKKKAEERLKKAFEKESFYKKLFTHDINNILHIIQTSLSLFTLFQNDSEKAHELTHLVKMMKEQIVRGTLLVSNVRRLSEIENQYFTPESVDVCDALRSAIKFVKEGFQNTKIDINVKFDGNLFFAQANELLANVFENIIMNAVKYNDNPLVEISIKISTESLEDVDYVKIEFLDNGIGVPDEKKEQIFQEGNASLKGGKGMGFGLTLVKKIVESYRGRVWVEDRVKGDPSSGSNFIVIIPKQISCNYNKK